MSNIRVEYLYRDAGNYKKWGEAIFTDEDGLSPDCVESSLRESFLSEGLFIASQIGLPELFLFHEYPLNDDDHCFHELYSVGITADPASDLRARSISQFLADAEAVNRRGWIAFDPASSAIEP